MEKILDGDKGWVGGWRGQYWWCYCINYSRDRLHPTCCSRHCSFGWAHCVVCSTRSDMASCVNSGGWGQDILVI